MQSNAWHGAANFSLAFWWKRYFCLCHRETRRRSCGCTSAAYICRISQALNFEHQLIPCQYFICCESVQKKKKRSFVLWAPPCEWHSSYLLKWTPTSKLYRASFTLLQPKHATVRKMVWISRKFKRFITQKPSPVLVAASTITGELSVLYHCWWRDRLSKVSSCVPRTFPPVTNYNTTVCNLQLVEFMMIPFIPLNVWMPKCRMIRFDSIWRTVQKKMRPLALCRREPASPRAHRNSDMTTWDWRLSVSFSTGLSRHLDFAVMLPST